MLKVESVSDYLRVSGRQGAHDWLYLPEEKPDGGFGVAGPDHIWTCTRSGRFRLLSVPDQGVHAEIDLEAPLSQSLRLPSPNGRHLYLLQAMPADRRRLIVIDVVAGRVAAIHDGLPGHAGAMIERADGRLLIDFVERESGAPRSLVMLLHPLTGEREQSFVASPTMVQGRLNVLFVGASPDGRYWLKFDHTRLPAHRDAPSAIGKMFGRKGGEPRYGLSLQIWESFPMRLVRQVTVAWLKVEDLPDETRLSATPIRPPAAGAPDPMVARRAIWDAISSTLAASGAAPLDDGPAREAYPAQFAGDDKTWRSIADNFAELAKTARVVGWQPDGDAFWLSTGNFLTCVGLDGSISPRLFLDRHGVKTAGVTRPLAETYKAVEPLPDRRARVVYETGAAIFDGRAQAAPYAISAIPAVQDQWRDLERDQPGAHPETADLRRVRVLERVRNRITIPVAAWSDAGRIGAIKALTAEMTGELYRMAVDSEVQISFASADRTVSEHDFFAALPARAPTTTPALRELVESYVRISRPDRFLFSVATDGVGLLAGAVRALGCLDRSALDLVRDYGRLVDRAHEYSFAGETVPAIADAHGWTDEVVDFVFWAAARDFYNTRQDHRATWRQKGLREALSRRAPDAAALRVLSAAGDLLPPSDRPAIHGTPGLDRFAEQIADPLDPWTTAFLDGLRHAAKGLGR